MDGYQAAYALMEGHAVLNTDGMRLKYEEVGGPVYITLNGHPKFPYTTTLEDIVTLNGPFIKAKDYLSVKE